MQSQSYAGHSKRAPSFQNKSSSKLPCKQQSRQARCTKTNSAALLPRPGSESCGQTTLSDVTRGILRNQRPCREALHNTAVHCPSLEKNLAFFSVVSYSLPTVPTGLFPDIYPKTFSYFHSRFFQYPDTDTSRELLNDHSAAVLFLRYK